MNNKVSLGVSGPGGGCTGCVGPNIPWTPRRLEEGVVFGPCPPLPLFERPKCLRGVGVKDCTWAPPTGQKDSLALMRALFLVVSPTSVLIASCLHTFVEKLADDAKDAVESPSSVL